MHTKFWSEKPEGKRKLGRPWRRWEDDIKIDLRVGRCRLDASASVARFL
jgi:hypothetical protein